MTEEIKNHLEFIGYTLEEVNSNGWIVSKPSLPIFTVVSTDNISVFSWRFATIPLIEEKMNELNNYINILNNHSLITRWSFFDKELKGRAYYLHPYNKVGFFNFINIFAQEWEILKDEKLGALLYF